MVQKIELWAVQIVVKQCNKHPNFHRWFANKDGIDHILDWRMM
jgi:hypothetical protein